MTSRLAFSTLAVLLAGCSPSDGAVDQVEATTEAGAAPADRFDPHSVAAARTMLGAEAKVIDFVFDPGAEVEWHVAVADDGSPKHGFAEYICLQLREAGAYDEDVDVRIVDAAKRTKFGDAYRDYSLGAIRCSTEQHID